MARFNPFPKLNCSYGAPMGRHSTRHDFCGVNRFAVSRPQGEYDSGGAYWGSGGPAGPVWAVWERNKRAILELAAEQDSEIESVGLIKFVSSFGCVDETEDDVALALYAGRGDAVQQVYNALAWYVLEEVCRSYVDLLD